MGRWVGRLLLELWVSSRCPVEDQGWVHALQVETGGSCPVLWGHLSTSFASKEKMLAFPRRKEGGVEALEARKGKIWGSFWGESSRRLGLGEVLVSM